MSVTIKNCITCKQPYEGEFKSCSECLGKQNIVQKRHMSKKRSLGICASCHNNALEDNIYCEDCRVKDINRKMNKYFKRQDLGLCTDCGKILNPDSELVTCVSCNINECKRKSEWSNNNRPKLSEIYKNRAKKRKESGLCSRCGKIPPEENKSYCINCLSYTKNKAKEKRIINKSNGVCHCGNVLHNDMAQCIDCWFKEESKNNTGTNKNYLILKEMLEKQNYKCFYTGKPLIIGENASLDHSLPRSRGGLDIIENLKWVDIKINSMKHNKTHEEFLEVISLIFNNFSNTTNRSEVNEVK